MTLLDVLQLIGTICVAVLAWQAITISRACHRPARAREALRLLGIYLALAVIVRLGVQVGALDQQPGRVLNGLVAVPFIVMMASLMIISRTEQRVLETR